MKGGLQQMLLKIKDILAVVVLAELVVILASAIVAGAFLLGGLSQLGSSDVSDVEPAPVPTDEYPQPPTFPPPGDYPNVTPTS